MRIRSLQIYCDTVRLHSFSKGAELNQVTQSTASQIVTQLERDLGVPLLDRSHRPFKVTRQGQVFYAGCRDILDRYHTMEVELEALESAASSSLRIGCIYSVGVRQMDYYRQAFSQLYPAVKVYLEYLHPHRVYESLLSDENIDMGIVSYPRPKRGLTIIPWQSETMVLACHPDHPLANRKTVDIRLLAGEDFVGFDEDLVIRTEIDRYLRGAGVAVSVVLTFDNIESIKRAVENGSGISILPDTALVRETSAGLLAAAPLARGALKRPLGVIHRKKKDLNPNICRFIELLQTEPAKAS
ncbi:LysR family transcriptional regulator [Candidatus Latescibacterota bacterium]